MIGLATWADFLEGDYWKRSFPDSGSGCCLVCGKRVHSRYVGSHFQQTGDSKKEHQKAVKKYDVALKTIFVGVLKDHGLRLKDDAKDAFHGIWWTARLWVRDTLYDWDKEIEEIA